MYQLNPLLEDVGDYWLGSKDNFITDPLGIKRRQKAIRLAKRRMGSKFNMMYSNSEQRAEIRKALQDIKNSNGDEVAAAQL